MNFDQINNTVLGITIVGIALFVIAVIVGGVL